MQHRTFSEFVAATLADRAPFLARRWEDRAQAATPRRRPGGVERRRTPAIADAALPLTGAAHAESVVRALGRDVLSSAIAAQLLAADGVITGEALATAEPAAEVDAERFGKDAPPSGEVMRLGWAAGAEAYATELSIHHVVRDADLLLSIVLADLERVVLEDEDAPHYRAAEAIAVSRRLHRAAARYTQAAVSGFVHALLHALRERYRVLRHDLRNPLGTIRSALSLMEDESVPLETRHGPGIRAMVARNAGSLDRLIARGLDDRAAAALLAPAQEIVLRDVALAARREVREAARLAGCEIVVVDGAASLSRIDPAACELTLTALLLAGLAPARPGSVLRIDGLAGNPAERGAFVLEISIEPGPDLEDLPPRREGDPWWETRGLDLAASLAADHGGQLTHQPPGKGTAADIARYQPAPDPMTLGGHPTLYLYLPLTRADDAAVAVATAQSAAPGTPPAGSDGSDSGAGSAASAAAAVAPV